MNGAKEMAKPVSYTHLKTKKAVPRKNGAAFVCLICFGDICLKLVDLIAEL